MKNKFLPLLFVLASYGAYSQTGIGTLNPNPSAQLEIQSTTKGVLFPRVSLTSSTDTTTIAKGNVNSLFVYNTATAADVIPGYYYWYNNKWTKLASRDEASDIVATGNGAPGERGQAGYPGANILIYKDLVTNTVYVQNADGTWTSINGKDGLDGKSAFEIWKELPGNSGKTEQDFLDSLKGADGEVGVSGGTGVPGDKGTPGYPGASVNIYTDTATSTVYVQNSDGTWTPINGKDGKDGKDGEVGVSGGTGVPGAKGTPGYPGEGVNIYTDTATSIVYVQNADGTWTPINGKDGEVGVAGGTGVPGDKGTAGYPGASVNIYTDTATSIVYVQNADGTWTPINGKDGEVGVSGGTGVPGDKGTPGYPGASVNIYTDTATSIVYVQNADGTWTPINGKDGEVGVSGGTGVPGDKGTPGYPGASVNIYTDTATSIVYVQNADGTWTPINGKDGEVGVSGGTGVPGDKGTPGYPGASVNIYTDTATSTVYVQNSDGTWTPINGKDGKDGKDGEVGVSGGTGVPGAKGTPGYPGEGVNIYTDTATSIVYVQNADGTWTPINGKDGEVGVAGGTGVPGDKGTAGYPGASVNIYTDTATSIVYVQNADGTWTPINGKDGEVGVSGGTGVPGDKGTPGYPGASVNIYTDTATSTVYVQNSDGTWTPINGNDGKGITSTAIDPTTGNLIVTYTDGSTFDAGKVKGDKGEPGTDGTAITKGELKSSTAILTVASGANRLVEGDATIAITPGTANQVMVTKADSSVGWVNPETITNEPWFEVTSKKGAKLNTDNIYTQGWVGIGFDAPSAAPGEKLRVNGTITTVSSYYADYVFEDYFKGFSDIKADYKFKSLSDIDAFIKANKHLPGITPINELEKTKEGYSFNVSELSIQLLEKTEELYLHVIEQQKELETKNNEIQKLNERLEKLEKLVLDKK